MRASVEWLAWPTESASAARTFKLVAAKLQSGNPLFFSWEADSKPWAARLLFDCGSPRSWSGWWPMGSAGSGKCNRRRIRQSVDALVCQWGRSPSVFTAGSRRHSRFVRLTKWCPTGLASIADSLILRAWHARGSMPTVFRCPDRPPKDPPTAGLSPLAPPR